MQKIKKLVLNGTEYTITDGGAVRFDGQQSLTQAQKQQAAENLGLSGTWRRLAQLDLSSGATSHTVDTTGCTELLAITTAAITGSGQSFAWKGVSLPDPSLLAVGSVKRMEYLGDGLIILSGPRGNSDTLLKSNIATGAQPGDHTFTVGYSAVSAGTMEVWGR